MEDKMRENQLKWFGHVQWKPMSVSVMRLERIKGVGGDVRTGGRH